MSRLETPTAVPSRDRQQLDPASPTTDTGLEARPGRRGSLIVAAVVLIALDLVFGFGAAHLSETHRSTNELRVIATELGRTDASTVLVIGNQVVAGQLADKALSQGLTTASARPWSASLAPVEGSTIMRWAAAYDEHFARTGSIPDTLVIGFIDNQLEDQNQVDWTVIGRQHTSWRSLPDRARSADDLNAKVLVTASRLSALVGERRWFLDLLNEAVQGHASVPRSEPATPTGERTYRRLGQFITSATDGGTEVVVVALPSSRSYEIPDPLAAGVTAAGATFVDLRMAEVFAEDSFDGPLSLTPRASATLTARLADRLAQLTG